MLSATGCSTLSAPEPTVRVEFVKPEIPASAKTPCADPVAIPVRKTTEKEAFSLHKQDRLALVECEGKRKAAVDAIQ